MAFSAPDRDNDIHSSMSCAANRKAGWWFANCEHSLLNGINPGTDAKQSAESHNIQWEPVTDNHHSLRGAEMAIRPMNFGN